MQPLLQRARFRDINAQLLGLLNLSQGADEPVPCGNEPHRNTEDSDNAHSYNSVVDGLGCDGISGRQAEDDSNESNPAYSDKSDGTREDSKVEWAFSGGKVFGVDEAGEDRDSVGDVKSDCGDRSCGCESHRRTEGGEREAEGEEDGKPDCSDWGTEFVVDLMEEAGNTTITGEGEHHSRVGRDGEETAVPNAKHDEAHENHCSIIAKDIDEDL